MSLIDELFAYLQPFGMLDGLDPEPLRRWFCQDESLDRIAAGAVGRPTVTLAGARALVTALAGKESLLLLSAPGVGKTEIVTEAARAAGLRCQSLLGTQLAPEDLTGVPRIDGARTVFFPPRVILPEDDRPFCLFLDELPAAAPDVQKAMYSLLLERRLGEHRLPTGTWVVAAGNRSDDRALVRPLSTALVNRLFVVHVNPSPREWLTWAEAHGVREDVRRFVRYQPDALMRDAGDDDRPFSTPRAWASLGQALDRMERIGALDRDLRRVLAHGRVSPADADRFCAFVDVTAALTCGADYLRRPDLLPDAGAARWSALAAVRDDVSRGELDVSPSHARRFLSTVEPEERAFLLNGLVPSWGALVGAAALRDQVTRYLDEISDSSSINLEEVS